MAANRHTCCICHVPRQPVEKHHINENPADNAWANLAILCRNCHGLVTATSSLGARYTPGEVLQYKRQWELRCEEAIDDDIESPVEEIHETKVIGGDEHQDYPFDMTKGDELVFSIDANDYLDLVICDTEDFEGWAADAGDEGDCGVDDDDDGEQTLPDCHWFRTAVIRGDEYRFVAPEDGRYVLLLVNWDDEPTEVTVDASVWEDEE